MSNIDKQALVIPQRERHDWSQAVMRNCDFCQQWALTVRHSDGGCICASCCDSEYTTALSSALVVALDELEAKDKLNAELMEKQRLIDICHGQGLEHRIAAERRAEAAEKRIAELSQKSDIYDMLRQDYELQGSLVDFVDWQEKRIAELEASHSNLREAMAGIHNTITAGGAYTPLAAIMNASKRAYEESAAAAAKGEAS